MNSTNARFRLGPDPKQHRGHLGAQGSSLEEAVRWAKLHRDRRVLPTSTDILIRRRRQAIRAEIDRHASENKHEVVLYCRF